MRSHASHVHGDEPGVGKGIKSGTVGGISEPITHAAQVRAEGSHVIRHLDQFYMNNRNTPDFFVAHYLRNRGYNLARDMDEEYTDYHLFTSASNRLGRLEPGEIFGFFPSRQMGGEGYPEDMRKVKIVEHLLFHAQLDRATLIGWEPIPDGGGLRRPVPIRKLGPQGE